ncbi:hypothetical protein BS47DRAFT_1400105 [Hydnum rufescens UP504]|uniref:Uncharacterized protein n=1 Tax=Hydnum rufescens UP504 TaxID=1448309 RepID=A0A9P6AJ25_9AGAM|nr:hypothetical protein BS47DRAFT_1400105 [Hydnum rufescens UP504]
MFNELAPFSTLRTFTPLLWFAPGDHVSPTSFGRYLDPPDLLHLFHLSCSINSILERAPKNSVQLVRRFIGLTRGTPDSADACDSRYHTALFVGTFSLGNERSRRSQGVSLRAPLGTKVHHPPGYNSSQGPFRNQLVRLDLAYPLLSFDVLHLPSDFSERSSFCRHCTLTPSGIYYPQIPSLVDMRPPASFSILEELVVSVDIPSIQLEGSHQSIN